MTGRRAILTAAAIFALLRGISVAMGIQVVQIRTYLIASEPAEETVRQIFKTDGVIMELLATREEFTQFQDECHRLGIWLSNLSWAPLGGLSLKLFYSFFAVKGDKRRIDEWREKHGRPPM